MWENGSARRLMQPARRTRQLLMQMKSKAGEKYREFKRRCHLQQLARTERPILKRERALYAAEYGPRSPHDPLITVTIATWNRARLLIERAVASVLNQTYQNFEIVIVGDCCTDDTAVRLEALGDPRIQFVNHGRRGPYPKDRERLHMVAGIEPLNHACELARGAWIAHLDDDEAMMPDHLEVLLRHAQATDAELVYGMTNYEGPPGAWQTNGSAQYAERRISDFRLLDVPHSALLFRTYLRALRLSSLCWTVQLGGDWHWLSRLHLCGVRGGFVDRIVTNAALRPGTTRHFASAEDRDDY